MSGPPTEPRLVELPQPGHYTLPEGLRYAGLSHSATKGIFHAHFDLDGEVRLDFPLSGQVLADLIHEFVPLAGSQAKDLGEALAYIRRHQGYGRS